MQYGSFTLEGRLLKVHVDNEHLFRYTASRWVMDRLLDLVMVCGFATADQTSAKKYEKTFREVKDNVIDLINPFKQIADEAKRVQQKGDADRERRLEEIARIGAKGFGSLGEIKKTLGISGGKGKQAEARP